MAEAVRLLVWDLDETFWTGTVTEGGHTYNQTTHDIVVTLAKRGIISSICSKNDLSVIRAILEEKGIWDYFVFPSIDWSPKGMRIQHMIETVQLRPETVMLIDDNPMNLNEALHFVPGLQVAAETFIPDILEHPLFRGKPDPDLTRLQQYKLLERRKADEAVVVATSGGSNVSFLRDSHIKVRLEYDIEQHIDRAVELINRTNQLNFTKLRLPEDPQEARAALLEQTRKFSMQAGLVEVFDDYGNYGFCGFYMVRSVTRGSRFIHFCFSCRILNMGVEAWLYQRLQRPTLVINGEVLSDPITADPVDWIEYVTSSKQADAAVIASTAASSVAARGGCVLIPLLHYFKPIAARVIGEFNIIRDDLMIRLDHSVCFRYALEGIPDEAMKAFKAIGYDEADFRTEYFEHSGESPVWIFSNWGDVGFPLFRHKATGLAIPFRQLPAAQYKTQVARRAGAYVAEHFEPRPDITQTEVEKNLRAVFSRVPPHGRMFVLLAVIPDCTDKPQSRLGLRRIQLNAWTRSAALDFPQVQTLEMSDFIEGADEIDAGSNLTHFDRMVYFRLYRKVVGLLAEPSRNAPRPDQGHADAGFVGSREAASITAAG